MYQNRARPPDLIRDAIEEAPIAAVMKFLFQRRQIYGTMWTIFWRTKDDTLGLTDGESIYEKHLSTDERRELAGNVSSALLADKWRKMFDDRVFTPKFTEEDIDTDEVEIEMTHGSVNLQRIDEPRRIANLFNEIVGEFMATSKELHQYKNKELTTNIRQLADKRRIVKPRYQPPAKTRRTRDLPTGLHFSDDEEVVVN